MSDIENAPAAADVSNDPIDSLRQEVMALQNTVATLTGQLTELNRAINPPDNSKMVRMVATQCEVKPETTLRELFHKEFTIGSVPQGSTYYVGTVVTVEHVTRLNMMSSETHFVSSQKQVPYMEGARLNIYTDGQGGIKGMIVPVVDGSSSSYMSAMNTADPLRITAFVLYQP